MLRERLVSKGGSVAFVSGAPLATPGTTTVIKRHPVER